MTYTVNWYNEEHTVICYRVSDTWDWSELHRLLDDIFAMLDTVDHVTHLIGVVDDFDELKTLSTNATEEGRRLLVRQHPRAGVTVVVTRNALFHMLYKLIRFVFAHDPLYTTFRFATSMEAARSLLATIQAEPQTHCEASTG